mmetsp:Transcript_6150/g.21899  ORF Transcript_6150/g.21899 Transcript_6150/m.21899 type:complete len:259 (+) Transcript_6150:192-968(+)
MLKSMRSRMVPWSMTRTANSLKMAATSLTDFAICSMSASRSPCSAASSSRRCASSKDMSCSPGRRDSKASRVRRSAPVVRKPRSESMRCQDGPPRSGGAFPETASGCGRRCGADDAAPPEPAAPSRRSVTACSFCASRYRRERSWSRDASLRCALPRADAAAFVSPRGETANGPRAPETTASASRRFSWTVLAASRSSRSRPSSTAASKVTSIFRRCSASTRFSSHSMAMHRDSTSRTETTHAGKSSSHEAEPHSLSV